VSAVSRDVARSSPRLTFQTATAPFERHGYAISPRMRARLIMNTALKASEGAGNAGRPKRPQPRVRNKKAHEQVHRRSPETPGIPRAMVLTVSFALSPVIGLSCHRRLADSYPRSLTPASRRQDHTTSPSATQAPSSEAPAASTASRPTSVTIAKRPFVGTGRFGSIAVSTERPSQKFFSGGT
jgi:hypothetical protein